MLYQEKREDFLSKLKPDLRNGLRHLTDMSELLLTLKGSQTRSCTVIKNIKNAVQCLKRSENLANRELKRVDECTEQLTLRKGKLESECTDFKAKMDDLKIEHKAAEDNLKVRKEALDRAEENMKSSQRCLDNWREKERESEIKRNIGIGITVIPIVGWITGPIIAIAAQDDMERADRNARRAREERDNFKSLVDSCTEELDIKKKEKQKTESNISFCKNKILQIKNQLEEVKSRRIEVSDFQMALRKAVNILGILSGKVEVAKMVSFSKVILLKPLLNVMTEIVDLLFKTEDDKNFLMQEPDIKKAVEQLENTTQRVSAITDQHSALEDQFC
ncbi:myosin heavy chain, cardiac muscle isoform-like [Hypomesus transpacificus]|uniref:myosin heavy chain, cardiac muscle isoform-like n=1 Tax=Hypomesus transpacificus TaxID=137520 RepID=UPI001F0766B0|nr:myosin heavy chain, cardiac muscle isoform-like [Hypomesus transpacificus]